MKTISSLLAVALCAAMTFAMPAADPNPEPIPDLNSRDLVRRSIGVYRPIKPASNTLLCLEPATDGSGRMLLNPCINSATQFWGPWRNSNNIYRFQNRAFVDCLSVANTANGQPAFLDECTLSDGSGNSVSNAEWDIGTNIPPAVTTPMRTRVGGSTRNICLTAVGSTAVMRTCASTPGNDQRWVIGAD